MARPVRPFPFERLPRLRAADVRVLRRCARWLPQGALALESSAEWLGVPLALTSLPLERCRPGELASCLADPLCAAILEPAAPLGARLALEIEPRFAAALIDRVLGGTGDDAPPAPGALMEAELGVLAYAIARLLAPRAGGALRLIGLVTTPEALLLALGDRGACCWPMRAELGGQRGIVRAWIPDALLDRADPPGLLGPHAAGLAQLEVEVVVAAGGASLRAREVGELAEGDVVVLDAAPARWREGALAGDAIAQVRGGSMRWRCALEPVDEGTTRLVLRARERGTSSAAGMRTKEGAMDEKQGATLSAMLEAAGDAPVELVVELARFAMPLGELAALRPGEVLATGKSLGERVTLRAGDRVVALGELVEIEGEIGVRVLALE